MCRVIGDIHLVSVGAGALALTHRPRVKALPGIRAAGVTHLVTLLSEREGALALGAAARAAGLEWASARRTLASCQHVAVGCAEMRGGN